MMGLWLAFLAECELLHCSHIFTVYAFWPATDMHLVSDSRNSLRSNV